MRKPNALAAGFYLLTNLVTGIFWFTLSVVLTVVGFATAVIWVGLPLLWLAMNVVRGGATVERSWVRAALRTEIPRPYREKSDGTLWQRWKAQFSDPATWRDYGYLLLLLPVGVLEFAAVLAMWTIAAAFIAVPFWIGDAPFAVVVGDFWTIDSFASAWPISLIGLALVPFAVMGTQALGVLHGKFARAMLGPTRADALAIEAERLQSSRARGVEAAEAERRRIERDLHDGAQQRLVAVAMGLGRAKSKMDSDPEGAAELIAEAHADAKLAIKELRDLARGIYPSVLGDRGLDAALSALAARLPIEVDLQVDVDPRPPTAVESAAYFTVGEALTNITKHSNGTRATVRVTKVETGVLVEVTDNGQGGAELKPGGGLAGLADRAATIDGVVVVVSPVGGPTVIRAELPCAW
ncbi:sensor histidine kinase [Lentzea sp.]|uniref:sensor histidine kinase n=1 Tax=Lentzea sp. TaxID=56099 RepID=UPI002BBDE26A|nr:sensor domain-containing protein [Lentzea sp.]HUQ54727.1 sensor domain-containing protein [Lentzea sp.]